MRKLLSVLALCLAFAAGAQNKEGGISPEMLQQIQKGYTASTSEIAAKNALSATPISSLVTNGANLAMSDSHFSHRVKTSGITNQKRSGRCWLFSGLNILRARINADYRLKDFEFSQNYCSFYDLLEKGNLFLQSIIDTRSQKMDDRKVAWLFSHPIGDGGVFTGVANLVMKYGLVPKEVMPETYQSENTVGMRSILATKLRQYGMELREIKNEKEAMARKTEQLKEYYRILVECLGVPPTEFDWTMYDKKDNVISTGHYTPKSFFEKFVGKDLNSEYLMFMNDPSREYYKVYEIELDRHLYDGDNWLYVNLPVERIKEMAIASIKDNTAMYFSCDVRKFLNRDKGTLDLKNTDEASLFATDFPMDKRQRILSHASGSSHAMTLIAVDMDENGKPKKWLLENSWGKTSGLKGNLIMTDDWFNEYMFRLVVERKYVPEDIQAMFKQKPTVLPIWDPMFQPEL